MNYDSWGLWKEDNQTRPLWERLSIAETGYWIHDMADGELFDPALAEALLEFDGSFLDMGCGQGGYVRRLRDAGKSAVGLDGNPHTKNLPYCCVCDLTVPMNGEFDKRDWVVSLEVGEHIPEQYEQTFLDNIAHCSRRGVIISWAVPGDIGTGHVNCRPLEWLQEQMEKRGFWLDVDITEHLRNAATLPYFKRKVTVFMRPYSGTADA